MSVQEGTIMCSTKAPTLFSMSSQEWSQPRLPRIGGPADHSSCWPPPEIPTAPCILLPLRRPWTRLARGFAGSDGSSLRCPPCPGRHRPRRGDWASLSQPANTDWNTSTPRMAQRRQTSFAAPGRCAEMPVCGWAPCFRTCWTPGSPRSQQRRWSCTSPSFARFSGPVIARSRCRISGGSNSHSPAKMPRPVPFVLSRPPMPSARRLWLALSCDSRMPITFRR
mmetsp:Transcript_5806/g.15740  ORF Transcript_5806/g.15740 Transcript_5806/m.15740 type:complete len:223 (-) Transcript_5806:601-1269(-)